MTTLADAFASFGTVAKNPRWSWSTRNEDRRTVVMTLWKDRFDYSVQPPRYRSSAERGDEWLKRPGNRERLDNLIWAADNCGGEFRIVIIEAKDVKAEPREIKDCYPQARMLGRIIKLDRSTGEFEAEILDTPYA